MEKKIDELKQTSNETIKDKIARQLRIQESIRKMQTILDGALKRREENNAKK